MELLRNWKVGLLIAVIVAMLFLQTFSSIAKAYPPPPTPPPRVYYIPPEKGCFERARSEAVVHTAENHLLAVLHVQTCFRNSPGGSGVAYINFLPVIGATLLKGKSFEVLNQYAPIAAWIIQVGDRQYLITATFSSDNGVWFINNIIVS